MAAATGSSEADDCLCCLFCQTRKVEFEATPVGRSQGGSVDAPAFFICAQCESLEPPTGPELRGGGGSHGWATERVCEGAALSFPSFRGEEAGGGGDDGPGVADVRQDWLTLRSTVKMAYRLGLTKEGLPKSPAAGGKERKALDVEKLRAVVRRLCARDPEQLYLRLEALATAAVMELQVALLEILVSPEKLGLEEGGAGGLSLQQTKRFLRDTLDAFSSFQDTVRNMAPFMIDLDEQHLEKFGITWKVLHHHIFDAVLYQNSLVQSSLPVMSSVLKIELVTKETEEGGGGGGGLESTGCLQPMEELPPGAFELAQSFRALDRLMKTSRQIWDKASARMHDLAAKQMHLYRATLKAKQRMLKEDLEFFKLQRRLLAECVAKSGSSKAERAKRQSEAELADFTDTIRELLTAGRRGLAHGSPDSVCSNCKGGHFPCDECTISHMITCGLVGPEEEGDIAAALPADFFKELSAGSGSCRVYEGGTEESESEEEMEALVGAAIQPPNILLDISDDHSNPYTSSEDEDDEGRPNSFMEMLEEHAKTLPKHPSSLKNPAPPPGYFQALMQLASSLSERSRRLKKPAPLEVEAMDDQEFLRQMVKSGLAKVTDEDGGELSPEAVEAMLDEGPVTGEISSPFDLPLLQKVLEEEIVERGGAISGTTVSCSKHSHSHSHSHSHKEKANNGKAKAGTDASVLRSKEASLAKMAALGRLERTGVIAEAKPPPPPGTQRLKRDSVSVATQVETTKESLAKKGHADHDDGHIHHDHSEHAPPCSDAGARGCVCCCYCQMFGKENRKETGRDDYTQIRERLRQKLKKREGGEERGKGSSSPAAVDGIGLQRGGSGGGEESLEALLSFIEGKNSSEGTSKAAAKRQRKRAARASAKPATKAREAAQDDPDDQDHRVAKAAALMLSDPHLSPDDVFRPMDEVGGLGDVDREVEAFKRLVSSTSPALDRRKIQLNVSAILQQANHS